MRGLKIEEGSSEQGNYGRMFPKAKSAPNDKMLARALGDPETSPMYGGGGAGWNFDIPAGFTYLGQFIDHDITFDPTPLHDQIVDPNALENFRTPTLELDSVYGSGPGVTPYFYDPNDPRKLLLGRDRADLPRLGDTAVIGDPRNDENLIISQLHVAFLNFHNEIVDSHGKSLTFAEAQQIVRWHYQWIVLHEYLPKIVNPKTLEEVNEKGVRHYKATGRYPFVPIEFNLAAFRFGHSQIRMRYDINQSSHQLSILPDLVGHRSVSKENEIDWPLFFRMDNSSSTQASMPIGPFIAEPLLNLPSELFHDTKHATHHSRHSPAGLDSPAQFELSLAYRDIRRGQLAELPSAHAVADQMELKEAEVLKPELVWLNIRSLLKQAGSDYDLKENTPVPLWIYILCEADQFSQGKYLGPLGSRIVTEVLISLLHADSESFVRKQPEWRPTLGKNGTFCIADLLGIASKQKER